MFTVETELIDEAPIDEVAIDEWTDNVGYGQPPLIMGDDELSEDNEAKLSDQ